MDAKFEQRPPGKGWAIAALITGIFLLASGIAAAGGYLRFRLFEFFGADMLVTELSIVGGAALGLVGGGLALGHGWNSLRGAPSKPLRLPRWYFFYIVFALVLAMGTALLVGQDSSQLDDYTVRLLFPALFVLGASLPVFAALAFAFRRLDAPLTWRQGALMFVSGGTLSIIVTFLLGSVLPYIFYLLIEPLAYLSEEMLEIFNPGGPEFFQRLFYSPLLIFYLLYIAFQAPFPEEFAKALGPAWMGRRITSERMAFALGLASGAGFAVVENLRYQGLFAQFYGWSWGGITALRGIGALDHALWTAIIALALYRERARAAGWLGRVGRAYLLSVGLHTLWNGGYLALLYLVGLDHLAGAGPSFDVYGEYIEVSLIIILVAMTLFNWWILSRYLKRLGGGDSPEPMSRPVSPRAVAVWAFASVLIIVPVGAALGQAWDAIRMAVGF
jgi:RsiW-degrading membrane proteinase PrsW (M82 family)